MVKKEGRQEAARWVVRNKQVHTQSELVRELRELGYPCTQATASRDIADLGLQKASNGIYVLGEDLHLNEMLRDLALGSSYVNNFCVIRTYIGSALPLADAFDKANLEDVLGTIAGTDTVLVICSNDERAATINDLVDSHIKSAEGENW